MSMIWYDRPIAYDNNNAGTDITAGNQVWIVEK